MTGEGGNFDYKNLFYLSIHMQDTKSGVQYARMRIARELLDGWLSKKVSLNGKKYDDSSVTLTDKDSDLKPRGVCLCQTVDFQV